MNSTPWPDAPLSGPVAVIADAHLGGPGGDGAELREQIAALTPDNCALALFLGDLFHVWVADPRFETAEIRAFLPALEALRGRGVLSAYVEGNRDFFLEHGPYARLFDRVALEISFEHRGVRYLAVHGDGLNARDRRYRFWRWLSKNRVSRVACGLLPGPIGRRAVRWTETQLAKTNFEHKRRLPEDVIHAYGNERLGPAHDVVLMGHFHLARSFLVPGGEVRLLDAWYNRRRLEWLQTKAA